MNKYLKIVLIVLALGVVGGAAYYIYQKQNEAGKKANNENVEEEVQEDFDESYYTVEGTEEDDDGFYEYTGLLQDVLKEEKEANRRGLSTAVQASGVASFEFKDGKYELYAVFDGLQEPEGDDFYEGWIVREEPFDFISTGELDLEDGLYSNSFTANKDYSAYDLYVLTIEPNDGDPAPAGHVLEGYMRTK